MDLLSVFKTENQRELLIQLLPGIICCWPFTYLVVHGLNYNMDIVLTEWTIIPIILAFLFVAWGIGFLLTDIASNLEIRLERIYFGIKTTSLNNSSLPNPFSLKDNLIVAIRIIFGWAFILFNQWELLLGKFVQERSSNSATQLHNEFYDVWEKYLSLYLPSPEPIVVKYYRGVLNRFKFEITMISAISVMLFGHFLIYLLADTTFKIDWPKTFTYLSISISVLTFLFIEAFKGVELLHQLRQEIIKTCTNKNES